MNPREATKILHKAGINPIELVTMMMKEEKFMTLLSDLYFYRKEHGSDTMNTKIEEINNLLKEEPPPVINFEEGVPKNDIS